MTARDEALRHFKRHDPRFFAATKPHHGALAPALAGKRTRKDLFSALVSIVVSQQLGVAAADSIFKRVREACGGALTPESILEARDATLRAAGLSAAKVKTLKAIAEEVKADRIDLISLRRDSVLEATAKLVAIWGLGPWSAEMFLIFAAGHPDIFSPGDLALVRAAERIYGLDKGDRTSLLAIAEKWSPYRTWACLLLWKSYRATPLPAAASGRHR
ncbi:MAG: DNA-3-methyladenine glycosylase 2 family protein [Patescibacteria group bacterium]|nr:DNA-3-methyladenine glycosylase 2 family protein [Patescibacteria group bacterium]MDE1943942.1 DNA-3-methyladenine glycosylase 2 family protein [Patescibacteria group bacterium]MDE1945025.1 DNA-3-methyladenine glycosylase 2 family protein [Patescibacteria group bacterium]MDE2057531.1 DNA-3-methyladenine glycosylase 2 family protein [Patescibacteria group bacterium]